MPSGAASLTAAEAHSNVSEQSQDIGKLRKMPMSGDWKRYAAKFLVEDVTKILSVGVES